jgi:hypothetical protein
MFFCVSTQAGSRSKKNARELPALWADIDFKNVDATPEQVIAAIATLRYPPTFIVSSGHGLHLYWRLAEWVDAQVHQEAVEHALHLLADHVAGDPAVCEVARLMRLPGTHNTKEEPIAVTAVQTKGAPVYAFGELLAWLEGQPAPILTRKPSAASAPAQTAQTVQTVQTVQTDPFRAAAMQSGFKPPIDVETRLGEMTYQGTGETGIHLTQIATSAALLHQGESIDDIVETLLEATRRAAGPAGAKWHWGREEKALRNMCRTWLEKHPELEPDEPERIDRAPSPLWASMEKTDPETGEVLDAKPLDTPKAEQAEQAKPAEPAKPKRAKKIKPHVAIAEAYLAAGEPMIAIEGGVWCYHDRLWRFETGDGWLNAELDHVAQELGLVSTSRLISEARNYLLRHKKVWRRQAPDFDHHGQIPTRSGLVDPLTGMLIPPAPEHYVTWRIEADYDPVAPCPLWRQLLADAFLDHPDAAACVQLIQELLGAGLIDRKGTERSQQLREKQHPGGVGGVVRPRPQYLDLRQDRGHPRPGPIRQAAAVAAAGSVRRLEVALVVDRQTDFEGRAVPDQHQGRPDYDSARDGAGVLGVERRTPVQGGHQGGDQPPGDRRVPPRVRSSGADRGGGDRARARLRRAAAPRAGHRNAGAAGVGSRRLKAAAQARPPGDADNLGGGRPPDPPRQ